VGKKYIKYQIGAIAGTYLLYTTYTLIRNCFAASTAYMNLTPDQVGTVLSTLAISYGISRPITGLLADKISPKLFTCFGLFASAGASIFFAFSQNSIGLLCTISFICGFFQSIGSPTSQKILSVWFPKNRRGTIIGIWSTSKDMGKVLISALVILSVSAFSLTKGNVSPIFILVSIIGILISIIAYFIIFNNPEDVNLKKINEHTEENKTLLKNSKDYVLKNKAVWFLCFAGGASYCASVGIQTWIPMLLQQTKGFSPADATAGFGLFSLGAIPAVLILCFISDAMLKGRRVNLILAALVLVFAAVLVYWFSTDPTIIRVSIITCGALFMGVGGLGVALTVDAVPPFALGTAGGMIGFFEYILGTVLATKLIGYLASATGSLNIGFYVILSAIVIEFICFLGLKSVEKARD
jgi:OPA family glycerol-3-phosphate transporter-like MFS transporter